MRYRGLQQELQDLRMQLAEEEAEKSEIEDEMDAMKAMLAQMEDSLKILQKDNQKLLGNRNKNFVTSTSETI